MPLTGNHESQQPLLGAGVARQGAQPGPAGRGLPGRGRLSGHQAIREAAEKASSVLVVELSTGQMIEDVQIALAGSKPVHFLNRAGGMLVSPDEVVEKISAIADGSSEEVVHA